MSRKTRKLIWSVPLVATLAIVGALALFMTLDPTEVAAQADEPPGQVGTVSAAAYDEGVPEEEIELTWEAPTTGGLASHYRIDISMNGGYTWVALEDDVRNTRYLHEDLSAGQMFHYRVFARNTNGTSPVSNIASTSTMEASPPDRPTNLNAMVGGDTGTQLEAATAAELTITLTWDAPLDPAGAPVLGYVVQYSDDGSRWIAFDTVADEGDGLQTTTHAELDAGVEYHYRVAAYNKTMKNSDDEDVPNPSFISGWSNTDTDTTLRGAMPPPVVPLEPGVSPSVTGVWLYWTPPLPAADPLGDPIAGYEVEGRPTMRFDDAETPALELCDVADCPFMVIKTDIDRPSGTEINSFQVTVRDVDANTTYDDDFEVNVPWEYRIRAINRRANAEAVIAAGAATDTDAIASRVLLETSRSVEIPVDARDDMSLLRPERLIITRSEADNSGRTGLLLKWNRAATLPYDEDSTPGTVDTVTYALHYRIEYSDDGPPDAGYDWKVLIAAHPADADTAVIQQTFTDNHIVLGPGNAEADMVNDLKAGQERHYRVFALVGNANSDEMSWPSDQKSGNTAPPLVPKKPTSLTARAGGHTSIDLAWVAPDSPVATNDDEDGSEEGTSVIKGYYIEYSDDEGKTWNALVTDDNGRAKVVEGTKYTDKGLMPGQTRDYQVAAVNMAGSRYQRSTWSNSAAAMTAPAPLPNEPGGLVAEADGQNAIKLCWNAQAEEAEDAPVTSYLIEYSPDGKDGTWMDLTSVSAMTDGSVHTVYRDTMGLSGDTERHYRVSAVNLQGQSDQSDVAMAKTGPATVPDAPTVTLGTVTDTEINFSWTRPASDGGSAITGWIVEKAYGGSFLDAERTNDDAFTDAQTWWDGLDCSAMVMAVMDSGMADMDNPFCAMYADLGDTEEAEVERVFDARYHIIDDPAVMSIRNFNLTPETEYMYRVAAVNAAGLGAWSNEVTATTLATGTTLGDAMGLMAGPTDDNDPAEIKLTWDAGANATTHTVVGVLMNDDGTFDTSTAIWITDATSPLEVEMGDRPEGTYIFGVVAGQIDGADREWGDWARATVAYPQ